MCACVCARVGVGVGVGVHVHVHVCVFVRASIRGMCVLVEMHGARSALLTGLGQRV